MPYSLIVRTVAVCNHSLAELTDSLLVTSPVLTASLSVISLVVLKAAFWSASVLKACLLIGI